MTDQELADKVVTFGIGRSPRPLNYRIGGKSLSVGAFLRDWRVAGALMEKCVKKSHVTHCLMNRNGDFSAANYMQVEDKDEEFGEVLFSQTSESFGDNLPRAIISACVAALEKSQ